MEKEYKLSATLYGHCQDVRAVGVTPQNDILSGSRDRTAKFWKFNSLTGCHQEVMTFRDQKNFVASVLYLNPSEEYPDGLVVTGGNDNQILVYRPAEPFALKVLKEHSNAVCCLGIAKETNSFLSGSWDNTVKFWSFSKGDKALVTFKGHLAAIWSVLQLNDGRIVTASADRTIIIWSNDGTKISSLTGHSDCVRCLVDLPELGYFASASNDASIKIWTYSGENLQTFYGHSAFIYGIARCLVAGDLGLVTSGEDRTVRIWKDGKNVQTINLPAQSIWAVGSLTNGDIVVGSSDGLVRVFTVDESRFADEAAQTKFKEEVDALIRQNMQEIGGYKVSDLAGPEALYTPGTKAGQNKMIRENGSVVLYTWVDDGDKSHWEKIGDVMGATDKEDSGKTKFEGQSYDYVFSVDVEDGKPPLKLPFNKGDDPYKAANAFLTRNALPAAYLEQVVDFILKNSKEQFAPVSNSTGYVDPFTGGSRYTPSYSTSDNSMGVNVDPFTGGSSYSTNAGVQSSVQKSSFFPQEGYKSFDIGDPQVVIKKLQEFNEKCDASQKKNSESFARLASLCKGGNSEQATIDLLFGLLEWPSELSFPVLDVVRMAVRFPQANSIICQQNDGIIIKKLLGFLVESRIENNLIVALRTLSNLCLHSSGEELVNNSRFELFENITSLKQLNKNGQVALSTLLLNMAVLASKKSDDLGHLILSEVLSDIITNLTDLEAQFRGYVALGTVIVSAPKGLTQEVVTKVKENSGFLSTLQMHVLSKGTNDLEGKRFNCAKQLQGLL